jgi:diguanylate cyclase (GGDEF)-like protein
VATLHVLLLSPETPDSENLRKRLISLGFRCSVTGTATATGGESVAEPDALLLPAAALENDPAIRSLVGRFLATPPSLPILLLGDPLSGALPEGTKIDEAMRGDLSDRDLAARLRVWCRWGSRARRLHELESLPREGPGIDPLTALAGHPRLMEQIDVEVQRHERYGSPLGIVFADVAGLRGVNEKYGHETGDKVLREIGETLSGAVRRTDMVARYSGGTFAIMLSGSGEEATAKAAARFRTLLENRIFRGEPHGASPPPLLKITASFGHASLPSDSFQGRAGILAAVEAALEVERNARRLSPIGTR